LSATALILTVTRGRNQPLVLAVLLVLFVAFLRLALTLAPPHAQQSWLPLAAQAASMTMGSEAVAVLTEAAAVGAHGLHGASLWLLLDRGLFGVAAALQQTRGGVRGHPLLRGIGPVVTIPAAACTGAVQGRLARGASHLC